MSNKNLAILGVIAAVMFIWAIVQSQISNRTRTVSTGQHYLVSGLDTDDIATIIIRVDDNTITLGRNQTGGFFVTDKDNYPADISKINDLITKCLEIEVSQPITSDSKNHEDLGVIEEKAKTVVKFITSESDSSILMGLIVGNTKEDGQGTYVRLVSSDDVYETQSAPWIDGQAVSYVKSQLVSLIRKDLDLVTVDSPEGKYILKSSEDGDSVELINIPPGKKLKESDAEGVFTALSSLSFTDVMKNPGDLNFEKKYICKLVNSTEFTFNIAEKDEKTFVTCSAVFSEGRPTMRGNETQEELKEKEEKLLLDDKAVDFALRHKGWVYEIPDYKAEYMTRELSDLVEDQEEPEVEEILDPNMILNSIAPDLSPDP